MAVFWVVAPCRIALMMEAARTSETLVNFYQTPQRYNPEDSHLPKIKLSRYTPWRRLRGEEVQFLLILDLGTRWGERSASRLGRAFPSRGSNRSSSS
jgi:hypothetical protein